MKKTQLIEKLDQAWMDLAESFNGLSTEQLQQPGVVEDWSVKDILAHVTWWEEEALKHLPFILQGGRPPRYSVLYGGIDAFNAQMTEKKRALSLAEVLTELVETHSRLVEYVHSIPEEQFASETRFRRRLRLDTYSHYPIHTLAIRNWRQGQG